MSQAWSFRLALVGIALLGLLVWPPELALARPGGGHTYSGGGSSSFGGGGFRGGGGGDGGGALLYLLIQLVFEYPLIGVPAVAVVVVVLVVQHQNRPTDWDGPVVRPAQSGPARAVDMQPLRRLDPDFSRVIFEDFLYRLYAAAHRGRHREDQLDSLAPYLSAPARAYLAELKPAGQPVTHVVVGAMRVQQLSLAGSSVAVTLRFDANWTVQDGRTFYVEERWRLSRSAEARTRPPGSYEALGCPNCGAPFSSSDHRRCAYCNEVVADGRFDWCLGEGALLRQEARAPGLTSNVPERGTSLPTVQHPALALRLPELLRDDPALDDASLIARLTLIFDQLNESWTARDLSSVRGLVSDGMYDYLRYWVDAYREQGLQNVLQEMTMLGCEPAKVIRDRHFDALTFRIWGKGLDFTVDAASGGLKSGSRRSPRTYSEYWTLIRSAARRGPTTVSANCPNCAAPLKTSMAGVCEHCSAQIANGDFDWVLSKIEQDDSYEG